MARPQRILAALPATSTELAAIESSTVRRINADLQEMKQRGLCRRTDRRVQPSEKRRGRWPALWVRSA